MAEVTNPYDPKREPKKWNVVQLLLAGETVAWDDLRAVAGGRLSPRTFGFILRDLEGQGASIIRYRTKEYGTLYRYDPAVPFDPEYRISRPDGPDAKRHPVENVVQQLKEGDRDQGKRSVERPGADLTASEDEPRPSHQTTSEKSAEALPEPLVGSGDIGATAESTPDEEESLSGNEPSPSVRPGIIDITDDPDLQGVDITTLFGDAETS